MVLVMCLTIFLGNKTEKTGLGKGSQAPICLVNILFASDTRIKICRFKVMIVMVSFCSRLYQPHIERHNVTVLLVVIGVGHHLHPFFLPLTPSSVLRHCVILKPR
jgi:hypothetical protein